MSYALLANATASGLNGGTSGAIDTTGANLLIVAASYGATAPTISDSKGNTWTALTEQPGSGSQHCRLYYCASPTVGSGHTFTASGASTVVSIVASAWSGAAASPYDGVQGGGAGAATASGVGASNLTPTEDNCLVIAAVSLAGSVSGFSEGATTDLVAHVNFGAGDHYGIGVGYLVQTTAAEVLNSVAFTQWTGSVTGVSASAVFRAGAPAGATGVTLSGPSSGTVGVASTNFTVGANGTITGTVTVTPSDSGGGGTFTPTSVAISSGTPTATFTYTPASSGAKTISVTNDGGLTNPSSITYTASSAGSPTSGTVSLTSTTATTITMGCTAASGGTSPYTYQWYRSTTANFTPGAGTLLSGATSLTLADSASLLPDTPYYYRCRVTDNAAQTADSNEIPGVLKAASLSIGFLGDSITVGFGLSAGQEPPAQAAIILAKTYKHRAVTATNRGVNGSTTASWLSGTAQLIAAKAAFAAAGNTHIHIMLGANDANPAGPVSAATYKSNLQNIITDLVAAGYKVILSYPTYIRGLSTAASAAAAQSYQAKIDELIDGVNVLRGDTLAFNYFISNLVAETQADLTHPNATGALALAQMWARAIDRSVLNVVTAGATAGVTRSRAVNAGA